MSPWPEIATIVYMTRPQFFRPSDPISEFLNRSVHYRTLFAKKLLRQTSSPPPREQARRPERSLGPLT